MFMSIGDNFSFYYHEPGTDPMTTFSAAETNFVNWLLMILREAGTLDKLAIY
jgi:hypothetical protein